MDQQGWLGRSLSSGAGDVMGSVEREFKSSVHNLYTPFRRVMVMGLKPLQCVYYPPEVRKGKYWELGVFLLQYFPLAKL